MRARPCCPGTTREDGLPDDGAGALACARPAWAREDWADGRSHRTPSDDAGLLAELRQQIADLPSYGYRRTCALVNRQRTARGAPRVNAKRVYRVMAQAALLLPKAPHRRQSARTHEGRGLRSHAATFDGAPMVWKSSAIQVRP